MADYLNGVDLTDLDSAFGDKPKAKAAMTKIDGVDLSDLDASFGDNSEAPKTKIVVRPDNHTVSSDVGHGLLRGARDVLDTGAHGLANATSYAADKILPESLAAPIRKSAADTIAADKAARDQYDAANPPSEGLLPTIPEAGRMAGQVLTTAPLMPVRAFQALSGAAKAIPYAGKLLSSVGSGALAGGIFGGAISSTNDDSVASNVGTNALYGAAAGPVAEAGMRVAGKAISGAKNISDSIRAANILKGSGIDQSAARNTLARLTDAGFTPAQANAELQGMGRTATLADLDPSLTTEAGGLAAKGGMPTSTLKSRFGERADTANNAAHDIMETKLGSKPDYEVEKEAAFKDRQLATTADYQKAKASNMALDVRPVVAHIASELKNAVGSEATYLKEIGSYLFDNNGNLKVDTAPLHKVRIALDGLLDKLPKEGTSQASGTYRAIEKVRSELDKVLKTNPDMANADAKFAKLAQDANGLDMGKKAISARGNYAEFAREFNNASPEKQEYMRKGLRIQIGDLMEKATRGELSEAQRLFGKSTSNRNIIKLAFGQNGEDVLDALSKEAKFRSTERQVSLNSATAERQAVQSRPEYGGSPHEGHYLTPVLQGAALDVVTGTPGGATAIGAGKGLVQGIKERVNRNKIKNIVEGTADLLSRQSQHGRTTALDLLDSVGKIRSRNKTKLPVDYSGLAGILTPPAIPVVKSARRGINNIRGISEQ